MPGMSEREPRAEDASRRTYLANERTLLAWWRTGLAAFAVAIGIGRFVPALLHVSASPFLTLGVGFGLLGLAFVVLGAWRDRRSVGSFQLADSSRCRAASSGLSR